MDNTRLFLYAGLVFISMLIYQQWQADYGPKPEVAPTQYSQKPSSTSEDGSDLSITDIPDVADTQQQSPVDMIESSANSSVTQQSGKLVTVQTDVYDIVINTVGGVLESVKLRNYPVSLENKTELIELAFKKQDSVYLIQSGLRSKDSPAPTHHSKYQIDQESYELADGEDNLRIALNWRKDGIEVIKSYEFERGQYLINVNHQIKNNSTQNWNGSQYRQIQRSRPLETSRLLNTYTGAVVYNEEIKYDKVNFDDIEEGPLRLSSAGGWIAMLQHYFLSAWIPTEQENNLAYSIANIKQYPAAYSIGLRSANMNVDIGSQGEFNSRLFIGPKLVHELEAISPGLDLTVDYGVLTFLSKPLYWLLEFFAGITGNWGFAIILLTLSIKAVFYKLSETSYRSMAKMRKVGPRLKTLKERYGDDKQKMNKAMMELYKTEKINPMGGCLPILVQIPVFIALYWALLESVELRQAPFILWIQDLSIQDPYFVLPVIMGISMFIQQRLNPTPPDPIQAKVMMALPLVFCVFFAFFPAGLVLYWVVNNILSIAQQWMITKRIEAGAES